MAARIGVYVCHCGINIAVTVDTARVVEETAKVPGVAVVRDYSYVCSDPGQEIIKQDILEGKVNRVVVAACTPTMHETTFRRLISSTGMNPYLLSQANIREQCSWVHHDRGEATRKALDLVRSAVARAGLLRPLESTEVDVEPAALVVGGGIAGMQAALDIADAGYKTYLVEKEPTIGGHMAQLDKTFPTLDCSACILTPRMVEVGQHENITLLTNAEVEEVDGYVGNFLARVAQKAPFVDPRECTACGDCAEVCPVLVPDEFNAMLSTRHAVYRAFPQAVPNVFVVDKRGAPPCRNACPAGVNAQGYVALISAGKHREALDLVRDTMPFAGVCGRVCPRPCESSCKRGEHDEPIAICALKRFVYDHHVEQGWEEPEPLELGPPAGGKVAIVGSGPGGLACAYDLVRMGHRVVVYEALPVAGGMLAIGIPTYRLPRDVLEKEIGYVTGLGVGIETEQALGRDFSLDDLFAQGYGAVILAVGAHKERRLGIEGEDLDGVVYCVEVLRKVNLGETVQVGRNVIVIGGGNAAVDGARTALRLGADRVTVLYRRTRKEMPADCQEVEAALREGIEITFLASPTKILGKDGKVTGVECVRMELGEPDESGRRRPIPVPGSGFVVETDMVLPAISQSPAVPYAADERLQLTSKGTVKVDEVTLQTSREGVFACGDAVSGPATVIDAVAGGKKAAWSVDRYIRGVAPGEGEPAELKLAEDLEIPYDTPRMPREQGQALGPDESRAGFAEVELGLTEEQARREADRCLDCGICSECMECVKVCEKDAIDHRMADRSVDLEVGAIVVATGFDLFDANGKPELGYDRYPGVITAMEMERLLSASGPTDGEVVIDGKKPRRIVFVHCVGSRDTTIDIEYCSRVCCMYTAKQAHLVKERLPKADVSVFYTDIRAFGKGYEEFYDRVRSEGVLYRRASVSEIYRNNKNRLIVLAEDTLLGEPVEVEADLVVLAVGMRPRPVTDDIARTLRLSKSADGFLSEAHPKLRPVDTTVDGVFLAGCCQSPKDIPDTVAQAKAASSSALVLLSRGKVAVEPAVAVVDSEACAGCGLCEAVCEYGAVRLDEASHLAAVTDVVCKGCGACAVACPSNAITVSFWTPSQLLAQVGAL